MLNVHLSFWLDIGDSIANPYIYRKLMQISIDIFNLCDTLRYAWATITYLPKIAYVGHLLAFEWVLMQMCTSSCRPISLQSNEGDSSLARYSVEISSKNAL